MEFSVGIVQTDPYRVSPSWIEGRGAFHLVVVAVVVVVVYRVVTEFR